MGSELLLLGAGLLAGAMNALAGGGSFVTLPVLKPTLLFVLVSDITINFLLFAPVFMLTGGGPRGSTNVLMYEAYKSGFVFGDMGRAMAIVVCLVAILLVIVAIQFRLLSSAPSKEAR